MAEYRCKQCGSEDLRSDAFVQWQVNPNDDVSDWGDYGREVGGIEIGNIFITFTTCTKCNNKGFLSEFISEAEPCVHCGAPILDGKGHDEGCSYE